MSVHDANYIKIKQELGIPQDEPIFVLRAQDDLAVHTLIMYEATAKRIPEHERPSEDWFAQLSDVIQEFMQWRNDGNVKIPD